jgi:hypothetical protein
MSSYMNSLKAQQDRHDIEPGHYRVTSINAHSSGSGRQQICLGLSELQAGIHPVDSMPTIFAPHDPLVDALWGITENQEEAQRGNLTTRPVWVVELGRNAKVLGFARATSVFGLGKSYGPYHYDGQSPDGEVYTVDEMRRKGHRY